MLLLISITSRERSPLGSTQANYYFIGLIITRLHTMLRFVATFTLLLAATALAAPQLNIPQGRGQQQQQAQVYQQAQAYQSQSTNTGSETTPVPILNFEDSQPGDGTFKYA